MGEMRVDLSELEETVRKLGRVKSAMDSSASKSKYNTELPKDALGSARFTEGTELTAAHDEMKHHIDEIINYLNRVIDEFGTNTKRVHGQYQEAEYEAKHGMNSGRSGSGN